MKLTKVFKKTLRAFVDDEIDYILSYGGSSSSKTISILQILLEYALRNDGKHITIVAKTHNKVRNGVLKDFMNIVLIEDYIKYKTQPYYNSSLKEFTLDNNSKLQFIGADKEDQIIGNRSDVLYFDECNFIKKTVFEHLSARCNGKVLASWNPSSVFYLNEMFDDDDVAVIHSTYEDNIYLDKKVIKKLLKTGEKNENFRRVYINGLPGRLKGVIFSENHFEIVEKIPHKKIVKIVYGLDYGFIDPTALIKLTVFEDKTIYIEELIYKTGLTPDKILLNFNKLGLKKTDKIIAETARPELTEYLYRNKFNIHKVKKTTIIDGINKMYDYYMYIDKDAKNIIDELRNYSWEDDKNGEFIEKPKDDFNHAIDAIRYAETVIDKKGTVKIL